MTACAANESTVMIFTNPDTNEREWLAEAFDISAHTLSSAIDHDEQGRLEVGPNHISLILKIPKNYCSEDNFVFRVLSLGMFLFKDRLIIVSPNENVPLDESSSIHVINDPIDIVLRVFGGTISHFLGHLKVINLLSEALEKKVTNSMANEHLLDMFTIEKSLVYYLNGLGSNQSLMEKFKLNAKRIGLDDDHLEFLDDIIIDNAQCNKQAEIYSNILTGLMEARGSIVSNNLNLLIKRLTIVNVVFMPLNLIASMGGMSEFSQMTLGVPFWISYLLFAFGITIIGFFTFFLVRRYSGDNKVQRHRPKQHNLRRRARD